MDIDALLVELGGLGSVLREATPPEKASIYHGLGLQRVYHPADKTVVATADLGRVLSRVTVVSEDRHVHYGHERFPGQR
jgi:hypothetical protein